MSLRGWLRLCTYVTLPIDGFQLRVRMLDWVIFFFHFHEAGRSPRVFETVPGLHFLLIRQSRGTSSRLVVLTKLRPTVSSTVALACKVLLTAGEF